MSDRYDTINLNQTLTDYAISSYALPENDFVADRLAPVVRVNKTPGKYVIFTNKAAIRDDYDLEVAPGAASNRSSREHSSATFECVEYGLAEDIPDGERDNSDPIIAPEMDATAQLVRKQKLAREKRLNTIVMTSGNWTNTAGATTHWNNTTGVKIETDIDAAKLSIHQTTGIYPNTIVIPAHIAVVAKKDSTIRDLIRYTDPTLLVSGELPPVMLGLNVIIPQSLFDEAEFGISTADPDFTWDDNNVWVGYVNPNPNPQKGDMTAMSTFRQPLNGSMDIAVYRWYEDNTHSTTIDSRVREVAKVVSAGAGYVITTCYS